MKIRSRASSNKSRVGSATISPITNAAPRQRDAERLDSYLVRLGWVSSRRTARELIDAGKVTVNGRHLGKGATVAPGDQVLVTPTPTPPAIQADTDVRVEVLYQDDSVVVINKPGLLPCHPLRIGERGTLINGIIALFPETAEAGDKPLEGGLVHRLD